MSDPFSDFQIKNEDDLILLETLIKSPVFAALGRAISKYRSSCQSILVNELDPPKFYRTQGLILGLGVVESLPGLLVQQRKRKLEEQKKRDEAQKAIDLRTKRT